MNDKEKNDMADVIGTKSKPYAWWICFAIVAVVIVAIVAAVRIGIKTGQSVEKSDKEEFFIEMDFPAIAQQNIPLPYEYEMKGEKNTLKLRFDKVESVYPRNDKVNVVVHGVAKLIGHQTTLEKADCEVLLKYAAYIVSRDGKLIVSDRILEKFEAYSEDRNVGSVMETQKMGCWRDFQRVIKTWEYSFAVPFDTREAVQLENNGLFVFEK